MAGVSLVTTQEVSNFTADNAQNLPYFIYNEKKYDAAIFKPMLELIEFLNSPTPDLALNRNNRIESWSIVTKKTMTSADINKLAEYLASNYLKIAIGFGFDANFIIELEKGLFCEELKAFYLFLLNVTIQSEDKFFDGLTNLMQSKSHSEQVIELFIRSIKEWRSSDNYGFFQVIEAKQDNFIEIVLFLYSLPFIQKNWQNLACELDFIELNRINYSVKQMQNVSLCYQDVISQCQNCSIKKIADAFDILELHGIATHLLKWAENRGYNIDGSLLAPDVLNSVANFLAKYPKYWTDIAYQLELPSEVPNKIISKYTLDLGAEQKMIMVFNKANELGMLDPSTIFQALKSVGLHGLAETVCRRYQIRSNILLKQYTFNDLERKNTEGIDFHGAMMLFQSHAHLCEWPLLLSSVNSLYFSCKNDCNFILLFTSALLENRVTMADLALFCKLYIPEIEVPEKYTAQLCFSVTKRVNDKRITEIDSKSLEYKDVIELQRTPELSAKISILLGFNPHSINNGGNTSNINRRSASVHLWMRLISQHFLLETGHLKELLVGDLRCHIEQLPNAG